MWRKVTCILILATIAAACGSDDTAACEQATSKLESCGIEPDEPYDGECSTAEACAADCVNAASCDEIEAFYSTLEQNDLFNCLNACG